MPREQRKLPSDRKEVLPVFQNPPIRPGAPPERAGTAGRVGAGVPFQVAGRAGVDRGDWGRTVVPGVVAGRAGVDFGTTRRKPPFRSTSYEREGRETLPPDAGFRGGGTVPGFDGIDGTPAPEIGGRPGGATGFDGLCSGLGGLGRGECCGCCGGLGRGGRGRQFP